MGAEREQYTIRRRVFKLFGAGFDISDSAGAVIGYCKQRAFRLREDMRVYTDATEQKLLLRIAARTILDFSTTYDVFLPTGELIGSLRRKGLKSLFRDEWSFLDEHETEIATMREESGMLAAMRRVNDLFSVLSPQRFVIADRGDRHIATIRQHANVFVLRYGIAIHVEDPILDDLLILAGGILAAAIEGRQ